MLYSDQKLIKKLNFLSKNENFWKFNIYFTTQILNITMGRKRKKRGNDKDDKAIVSLENDYNE